MTLIHPEPGEVRREGETVTIVFRRRYRKPVEKVWAALTVPERLTDWFAETRLDRLEVGGTMQLYFTGADYRSIAKIVAFDPPRTFAWVWSEVDGSKPSHVRFDLEPDGEGTLLTLTHSGLPPEEAKGVDSGWHAHLEAIEDAADGVFTPWSKLLEREAEAKPLYEARTPA
ncbi:SRPBCC family protein [Phenylobacterium terrae]|uniref:SRPBCC family protein n=1 Tax=Phenylobacterium terrae TaxID=2665495 RepID=A0ABW4N2G0_9CAUL